MTQKLQEGVMEAQSEAIKRNQQEVDIAHLLYTLIHQQDGIAPRILDHLHIDNQSFQHQVNQLLAKNLPLQEVELKQGKFILQINSSSCLSKLKKKHLVCKMIMFQLSTSF